MKEIKPYRSLQGIAKSLDNGGRFYNLMARADDRVVTRGELAKAAGVFVSEETALLFLEMSQWSLSTEDQTRVSEMLEPALRKQRKKIGPQRFSPAEVDSLGKVGRTVVVEGFLKQVSDRTMLTGMVMVPVMVGKVMIFTPVPITQMFAMYEIRTGRSGTSPSALIAAPKKWEAATKDAIRFGGVLRTLSPDGDHAPTHPFYIEAVYYSYVQ